MSIDRPLRADARRNAEAVVNAARRLFQEQGTGVPMEVIGREAGIGKGTLYRHFPTKDHVVAAVSRDRFDRLTEAADALGGAKDPMAAFVDWLRDFDRSAQRYRGLNAVVSDGIADEASVISANCSPMKASARTLLQRAQEAGQARTDIEITELLSMIAALPEQFRDEDGSSRLLDIVIRGIRS